MNYSNHILDYSNNYICLPKAGSQPPKEKLVVHRDLSYSVFELSENLNVSDSDIDKIVSAGV